MSGGAEKTFFGFWLFKLFSYLPLPVVQGVGAALGAVFAFTPNAHRRITDRNLERCFPELTRRERNRIARRSLIESGKTLTETILLWLSSGERVLRMVKGVDGLEPVEQALREGRGVIFAAPHLGSWEMSGLYASVRLGITALYRPPRMKTFDAIILQSRQRLGATLVPTTPKGVRRLYHALAEGGVIGILPDQDPREGGGVFAPFFGIPANTMTLVSRFASRTGAPVFIGWAERLPWGRGFHIHVLPVDAEVGDADPAVSAAAMNRAIETAIRTNPGQYQWCYKRFRTRPEGESGFY